MNTAPAVVSHAREYETVYIIDPQSSVEAAQKITTRMSEVVAREGGKLLKLDSWGRRRLAYRIRRTSHGYYFFLRYIGAGNLVAEVERNLKMFEQVIRYQSVRVDEDVDPAAREVKPEDVAFDVASFVAAAAEPEPEPLPEPEIQRPELPFEEEFAEDEEEPEEDSGERAPEAKKQPSEPKGSPTTEDPSDEDKPEDH